MWIYSKNQIKIEIKVSNENYFQLTAIFYKFQNFFQKTINFCFKKYLSISSNFIQRTKCQHSIWTKLKNSFLTKYLGWVTWTTSQSTWYNKQLDIWTKCAVEFVLKLFCQLLILGWCNFWSYGISVNSFISNCVVMGMKIECDAAWRGSVIWFVVDSVIFVQMKHKEDLFNFFWFF